MAGQLIARGENVRLVRVYLGTDPEPGGPASSFCP